MKRRDFLRLSALAAIGASFSTSLWSRAAAAAACPATGGPGPYGPLLAADALGLELPAGFYARIVATGNALVAGTAHTWHLAPDGGAVFRVPGGYVYVSNSERSAPNGGVGAIRFDHAGIIQDAYTICSGTARNCAGGATPWNTWLTCEEVPQGIVYECDPTGIAAQVARPALGSFNHEAATVDPERRRLYMTEDRTDGLFYRFTPTSWGDLSGGTLEAAIVTAGSVSWAAVPDPNPGATDTQTRYQIAGATTFNGGEGIVFNRGHVFFTTKGDHRVWDYDPVTETIAVFYDGLLDPSAQLRNPDNITASRSDDLIVAEDPGNLELVLLSPDCVASPFLRLTGQPGTELTGPAFDPIGRRLYFSSQRGGASAEGITYEISGPFRRF